MTTVATHPHTFAYDAGGKIQYANNTDTADSSWPSTLSTLTLDDTTTPTGDTVFWNQDAYIIQNGAVADNPNWPTIQLSQAKQTQLALLNAGLATTLNGGFEAKTLVGGAATPHTYPTNPSAQSNFNGAINAFIANPNKTSVTVETLDVGWVSHTKSEFYGIYADGDTWKEAQYTQLNNLIAQVKAETTVSGVEAIVWTPATY